MNLVVKKVTSEESLFVCLCDRANVKKKAKSSSNQRSNQHLQLWLFVKNNETSSYEAKICMILVFEEKYRKLQLRTKELKLFKQYIHDTLRTVCAKKIKIHVWMADENK